MMTASTHLLLGLALSMIGILMFLFNRWKIWRSRWFTMGGMWGYQAQDEKTALFATRFWGILTFLVGFVFLVLYVRASRG